MTPKISVIIPCYNAAKYLNQCLDSLVAQSNKEWEAIIVDDGSIDNSSDIVMDYIGRDSRFHYYHQTNSGAGAARNFGVEMSLSELILFLDADDWLAPNAVEESILFMTNNADYKIFNLRSCWCDQKTGEQKSGFCYVNYRHCLVYGQNNIVVVRKKDFIISGGFDISMRKGFEDWEFYVRLLNPESKVKISDGVLYYYRVNCGSQNVSSIGELNKQQVMKYIFYKNYNKYVSTLGAPQEIYQWADRRLPQLVIKIQRMYQLFMNSIHRIM